MLLVNGIQAEEILKALCRTFIHSLWQGLGFALLTGLLLLFTRRSSPALRYNLLALLLLCFVMITGFTFYLQMPDASGAANTVPLLPSANTTIVNNNLQQQFFGYCDAHAPLLVLFWFIVFMVKFVKMIGGLLYIKRIRSYGVSPAGEFWDDKLKVLAKKLHISISVKLLESSLIKVPVVTGWLKPIIMLPLGLLTELPADQIEAILLHELAHIRRKDYLVNLLQSFVEILFFFNPAVYWLSALLREEREHCCDDLAIYGSNNKATYIKALVSFQEYHLGVNENAPALAFAESKHQLLERVKRMIYNNNKNLNIKEKIFLMTSIFILVAIAFAPIAKTQAQKYHVWPVADTINGVIQPIEHKTLPVRPDNRLQHITPDKPADTLPEQKADTWQSAAWQQVRDSFQLKRTQHQRERDQFNDIREQQQRARDSVRLIRELQQQERDKFNGVRERQQQERDSLTRLFEKEQQGRDKVQQERFREDHIRAKEQDARAAEVMIREHERLLREDEERNRNSKNTRQKNVSRNVPATKPVAPAGVVTPAIPPATNY